LAIITSPGKMPDLILLSSPTSVGGKISGVGDWGTPGYRRELQESFIPKRLDILWIDRIEFSAA
jgi:hypothetical protein